LCFECFKAGMERTRARRAAWTQRELPFERAASRRQKLSEQEVAHRRQMLEHLVQAAKKGA
ncbi:MAG TPA: hypothetical protein VGD94_08420, partial [Vicinamibacterales bacterium]